MKVALIMERIETWRGGAETSTIQFANHLAESGCRVSIITTTLMPSTPSLHIVPIKATARFRAARTLFFSGRAAQYLRGQDYDIVHSITPCTVADVYQPRGGTMPETLERNLAIPPLNEHLPRGLLMGLKRISQKTSLKYRVVADLEKRLLRRNPPPYVIAISEYVVRQLQTHYRFDPARIVRVFNGVDPDESSPMERQLHRASIRRQLAVDEKDLVILCVAHNFKLKGVAQLIQAFARQKTSRPGRRVLVIVGRDNPAPYAQLARKLGVADHVLFAGPTQRIKAFFHASDFLVHPTFYDPCSRVVLEAMSAGLPVITTAYNGASERITDGREGYTIISPEDVDALAERMDRLSDDDHRRACAAQAPQAVQGATMKEHAEQVLALYEEILRTRSRERQTA